MSKKLLITGACGRFFQTCVSLYSTTCNMQTEHDTIMLEYNMTEGQKSFIKEAFGAKVIHYEKMLDHARQFTLFTHIAYAKYECFNLLSEYEQVLWLDNDTICTGKVDGIFSFNKGFVARYEHELSYEFKEPPEIFKELLKKNPKTKGFNAGVSLFNRGIPNLTEECYATTIAQGANAVLADQGVLNLVMALNSITVVDLPMEFNNTTCGWWENFSCRLSSARGQTAILHFAGPQKPWDKLEKGWIFTEIVDIWNSWSERALKQYPEIKSLSMQA